MPTVARSPSARAHSCSRVYLRSSGYIGSLPRCGGVAAHPARRSSMARLTGARAPVAKHSRAHGATTAPTGRSGRAAGCLRRAGVRLPGAAAHHPRPRAVDGDELVAADRLTVPGDRSGDGDVEPGGARLLDHLLALRQGGVVLVPGRRVAEVAGRRGGERHLVAPRSGPQREGEGRGGGPAGDVDPVGGVVAETEVG